MVLCTYGINALYLFVRIFVRLEIVLNQIPELSSMLCIPGRKGLLEENISFHFELNAHLLVITGMNSVYKTDFDNLFFKDPCRVLYICFCLMTFQGHADMNQGKRSSHHNSLRTRRQRGAPETFSEMQVKTSSPVNQGKAGGCCTRLDNLIPEIKFDVLINPLEFYKYSFLLFLQAHSREFFFY